MIIFLIGFMGCGKSTVGRRIASLMGCRFADTDKMVEAKAGIPVADIFLQHGEAVFRRLETEVLSGFSADDDVVVATGGGAACSEDNMAIMKATGHTVYLKTDPERLFGRLRNGRARRPKIASLDDIQLMEYITNTLAEREKYYSQASVAIDCNGVSDEYIASHIGHYLQALKETHINRL